MRDILNTMDQRRIFRSTDLWNTPRKRNERVENWVTSALIAVKEWIGDEVLHDTKDEIRYYAQNLDDTQENLMKNFSSVRRRALVLQVEKTLENDISEEDKDSIVKSHKLQTPYRIVIERLNTY